MRSVRALVTISCACSFAPHLSAAQSARPDKSVVELEEVVVTARLREERLQDIPISAQVVTGDELSRNNINSLTTLSELVPGLHIETVGRSTDMYLRGVGSGNNSAFNQSVGLFIDGVYHGRSRTSAATFLDLDRTELLRGPQSTYFGNNAIAGAISLQTRKPSDNGDSSVRASFGQFDQYAAELGWETQLSEALSMRVAAGANGQNGYLRNVTEGRDQPREDNGAARVTFLFEPSGNFDLAVKLEGTRNRQIGGLVQQLVGCPPAPPFTAGGFCNIAIASNAPMGLDDDRNAFDPNQRTELDTAESVITAHYRPSDELTVTSVTGYQYYDYLLNVAANATSPALLTASVPEVFHQVSQELRAASSTGGRWDYLTGVYFQDQRLHAIQRSNFFFLTPAIQANAAFASIAPFAPLGQQIEYTLPQKTYSVFGSVGFRPIDALKFDVGLRGSYVDMDFDQRLAYGTGTQTYGGFSPLPDNLQSVPNALNLGVASAQSASRTDRALMPSAQVQYTVAPSVMTYASFVRGFKAGGFNGVETSGVPERAPFKPEYVNAYEVGLKSKWLDNALLLNVDVFRSDYSGLQVVANSFSSTGAIVSLVRNAATSVSQGVELEARWLTTRGLRFGLQATYLDAYYDSYANAGATQAQQRAGIRIQDLSGRPTSLAPRWSGSLVATHTLDFSNDYVFITELTGFFSSKYFLSGAGTNDDLLSQDGYGRLDARLALSPSNRWVMEVVGKNLTNRHILVSGSPYPTSLGSVIVHEQMPRSVVGQVRYSF